MNLWLRRFTRSLGLEKAEPSYWERFASSKLRPDASLDDLLRWAVLGKLNHVRPLLSARADELRKSVGMGGVPNARLHTQALAIDWLVSGAFDKARAIELATTHPPLDEDAAWREVDWFNLLRPSAETAARFAGFGARVQRKKKRGGGGDGDTEEAIHRDGALFNLVASLRFGDTLCDPTEGAAAFDTYLNATLDFYYVVEAVLAITVRAALFAPPTPPHAALRWLKVS